MEIVEIWQNLEKNATQIMIFSPIVCGRKITIPFVSPLAKSVNSKLDLEPL